MGDKLASNDAFLCIRRVIGAERRKTENEKIFFTKLWVLPKGFWICFLGKSSGIAYN